MSSARILYLDDEEPLVFVMKRMLEHLGHQVAGFTRSADALAAFTAAPADFDLVLSDMSMPGMSGIEFARGVLAVRADIPVVIATGHVQPQDVERAEAVGVREVIQKPNTLEEMTRTVARLLNQAE
ncbi:MAG TPA: response regulator [Steroidobacteraceae bacterium]|nr:response regulator [Steroidobacteraceae bacterium]